jgi:hypothetical protein
VYFFWLRYTFSPIGPDKPNPHIGWIILLLSSLIVCILSVFPLVELFKKEIDFKKIIVFIVSAIFPVVILIFFMPTLITETIDSFHVFSKNTRISDELELKLKLGNEYNQSRFDDVSKKLQAPLTVKSFGQTYDIDNIFAVFYLEMSDGSIIVPLPQIGEATEEEVMNNLKKLVGKTIEVKLIDDTETLSRINYPIHKNTKGPFTKEGNFVTAVELFIPTEIYFVNILYKGKELNLLDRNLPELLY